MSKKLTFKIASQDALKPVMASVWEAVCKGIAAGPVVVTLGRESKSREQERKYHAMINDISKQVDFDGKTFGSDVWKAQLVDQFEEELRGMGKELTKHGRSVMSLDGRRVVQIRASTVDFKKQEAADFIEYLFSFGAENNIEWSDPETQSLYTEYWERTYEQQ